MRLIDADALMEKLEAWKKEAERINANINYTFASAIMAQVNAEPTIEERKTGEWIELDFTQAWEYKCDQCGRLSDFKDNFCPNCGADMRGERNDNN